VSGASSDCLELVIEPIVAIALTGTRPALEEAAESVGTVAVTVCDLAESTTLSYSTIMGLLQSWLLLAGLGLVLSRCSLAALPKHFVQQ
jgi:hypothetical protein